MDCPWDLSLQGWLPVPTPGSHGRAVLFLPSSQSPRTACLGDTGHLPRQHLWLRSVAPVRSQPHQPGLPPRSCPGLPSHCSRLWPSFLIWRLVYSKAFTNSENRGAAGGRGFGAFELWCGNVRELKKRTGTGVRDAGPVSAASTLQPSMAAVWLQQWGFFNHLFKVIFCSYPLTIPFIISSCVMIGNSVQRNKTLKYY